MKMWFTGVILVVGLLVASCGNQCPTGYNTTDPSCPGYQPYGYQQPFQQQPWQQQPFQQQPWQQQQPFQQQPWQQQSYPPGVYPQPYPYPR